MNGGGNQLQDIELLIQSRPLDRLADAHNLDATQVLREAPCRSGRRRNGTPTEQSLFNPIIRPRAASYRTEVASG
jgi:hypothetical protein